MKKIMMAVAIVCVAAFARAAAVDWTASQVFDAWETASQGKNVAANGWVGYVIMAADYATVTADLATGKTDTLVSKAVGPVKTSNNKGAFVSGTASGNVASGSQDFYLIVLNSATPAGATGYAVSSKTTVDVDASMDTLIGFGSMKAATQSTSNWTAVPEPTSGLLLLLGMAGLALKRKRA